MALYPGQLENLVKARANYAAKHKAAGTKLMSEANAKLNGHNNGRPLSNPKSIEKREKKTVAEHLQKVLDEEVKKRFKPMIIAQLDSAIGVTTELYDAKKDNYYYKEQSPNTPAAKLLLEYTIGKPTDHVKVEGQFTLVGLIANIEGNANEDDA